MKAPALAISKDLVNELKRLAVIAIDDESNFNKLRDNYVKAGEKLSSSVSEYAVTLFTFAERYAKQEALVDAQLAELGISYKSPSVYNRIVRLAVTDVRSKDNKAIRMHISRYGRLIEAAHDKGLSAAQFKAEIENGMTATMKSLGVIPIDKPKALSLGRTEASKNLSSMIFPLKGIAPPEGVNDGDEIELVARYENGQIVVYGMIPPNVSVPRAVLTKLGSTLLAPVRKPLDFLPHLQRALKLVTNGKEPKLLATYSVSNREVQFNVVTDSAVAALSAPLDFDFMSGKEVTLPVSDWGKICATLLPIAKHVKEMTWEKKTLVAKTDEFWIPDVAQWFEDQGKTRTIGEAVDASIRIDLKSSKQPATHVVAGSAWRDTQTVDETALKPLTDYKSTAAITAFKLGTGRLTPKSAKAPVDGHVNVNKDQLRLLKAVCSKLVRLSSGAAHKVTFEHADGYLRVSTTADNNLSYSVVFDVG